MNSRLIASMLVSDGDKYLFIRQNKPGGAYPHTLHIPGGGLDPGETPIDAAIREVREEVGIEVDAVTPVDFDWDVVPYKGESTLLIFLRFTGELASGVATPLSDAKEVIWIDRKELDKYPHNPPSLRLFSRLGLT
jgi:8-oxo-dGTP pyrophosphatase MutT (NUDIX family)